MLASQGCDSPVLRSSGLYEALERSHHGLYPSTPLIVLSDAWRGNRDAQGVYLCLGECRRDQTHPVASLASVRALTGQPNYALTNVAVDN